MVLVGVGANNKLDISATLFQLYAGCIASSQDWQILEENHRRRATSPDIEGVLAW